MNIYIFKNYPSLSRSYIFLKVLLYCTRNQHCPVRFGIPVCHEVRNCSWTTLQESCFIDAVGSVGFSPLFYIFFI